MQFRLSTLFLLFVVLWSSLAAFGVAGIAFTAIVVFVAAAVDTKPLSVVEWLVIIVIISILIGLLLPAVCSGLKPEDCRSLCVMRLSELAKALHDFHDAHGSFPPACVTDASGKPSHSWRVETLPYLGLTDIGKQYDRTEPWNGPKNSSLSLNNHGSRRRHGSAFDCLMVRYWNPSWTYNPDLVNYLAVVGPQAAWRGSQPTKIADLPNEGRRMILLVESADCSINWKEPKDLTFDEAARGVCQRTSPGISSGHVIGDDYFHHVRHGAYVAFVDGSVHFLPEDISPEDLRALLVGDTSRPIDLDALARPAINWSHITGLALFVLSSIYLILRTLVHRLHQKQPPIPNP